MQSNDRIKALWLCSWYPNRTNPYYCEFIYRQAKATSYLAEVVVLHVCGDSIEKYDTVIDQSEFLTVHVYYPKTNNIFLKTFRQIRAQMIGYKKVKQISGEMDIVHLNVMYPAGLFCFILSIWEKLPYIITEHSSIYRPERQLFKGFFLKIIPYLAIKWAKAVIMLTNYNVNIMKNHWKMYNRHYLTIPNVIDTNVFHIKETNIISKEKDIFTFLHVSWLDESVKNVSGIIRCAARLSKERQDFKLVIIGDTQNHAPLIALADKLGVLNKFIFLEPERPNNLIAVEMQKSDTFLMFSYVEGLPCVMLEAMSTGLPVLMTETGGISDWVNDETGILVNIGDEIGLIKAMNYMVDNYFRYNSSNIRSKIVNKCSVEAIGKSITNVYKDVLKK